MSSTNYSENIVKLLIEVVGDNPKRDGLKDTPKRVLQSFRELYSGYKIDPASVIKTFEDVECDEIVLLKDLEFFSMCEHHMLPFFGKAHIAYIPDGRVIGISKLARLLEVFARRLQIQERICTQVTTALMKHLAPKGAACILEARHLCMCARGVNKQNAIMKTSSLAGVFKEDNKARSELLSLIG